MTIRRVFARSMSQNVVVHVVKPDNVGVEVAWGVDPTCISLRAQLPPIQHYSQADAGGTCTWDVLTCPDSRNASMVPVGAVERDM